MKPTFKPMGDSAIQITFGDKIKPEINSLVTEFFQLIKTQKIEGIIDMIPAFSTLLINYDPRIIFYKDLEKKLTQLTNFDVAISSLNSRIFEIPVLYGDDYGTDLENVAQLAGITQEEVINIHSGTDYLIYMLGFLPGFPYLGGLDERIHTPRLATPRIKIRSGSVGIGGQQTGIYPLESPGGWQLIGRTPIKTYDATSSIPILFNAGDYIRFVPITKSQYKQIEDEIKEGTYVHIIHKVEDN